MTYYPVRFLTRPAMMPVGHGLWTPYDDIVFRDMDGSIHTVPGGWRVNGASIPRWIWWLLGHPLTTAYVYASALHDKECETRFAPTSYEVHARFERAVLAELLREWPPLSRTASRWKRYRRRVRRMQCHVTARVMGFFVHQFGPPWRHAV
jgi:hypothetical protein